MMRNEWEKVPGGVWGCLGVRWTALDRYRTRMVGRTMEGGGVVKCGKKRKAQLDHPLHPPWAAPLFAFDIGPVPSNAPKHPYTPPGTLPHPFPIILERKKFFEKISIFHSPVRPTKSGRKCHFSPPVLFTKKIPQPQPLGLRGCRTHQNEAESL